MVVEQSHQGCQRKWVHVAIELEGHGEDVEGFEVLESVEGVLSVDLAGGDKVVHDVLIVAGVGSHLLVVDVQLCNPGKSGVDHCQCEWNHGGSYGQMGTAPMLSCDWGTSLGRQM